MAESKFLSDLKSKTWRSSGKSTVKNEDYNPYPQGDWRRGLLEAKDSYYPPAGVEIKILSFPIVREAYSVVDSDGNKIVVPRVELEAFHLKITGTEFPGKEALSTARFIVNGDHAISNPVKVDINLYVVIHVRLRELKSGRLAMVNELIWSAEKQSTQIGSDIFYDIQKWYCCEYP